MSMAAYRWAKGWRGELTATELSVLLEIADRFGDETGYAWPSYANMADRTRLSSRTVQRSVKTLAQLGLVEVRARYTTLGDRDSNEYRLPLFSEPAPVDNSPVSREGVVTHSRDR